MFTDQKYLEVFKLVIAATLLVFISKFIGNYYRLGVPILESGHRDVLGFGYVLSYSLPQAILMAALWLCIGRAFDCKKEALIAMVISLLAIGANFIIKQDLSQFSGIKYLFRLALGVTPYLVFGYMLFKDKRALIIALVYFVSLGSFNASAGLHMRPFNLVDLFAEIIDKRDLFYISVEQADGRRSSFSLMGVFLGAFQLPILYLVLSRLIIAAKNKSRFLSGQTIDLSTTLSKGVATFIFVVFSYTIFNMSIGAISLFNRQFGPLSNTFYMGTNVLAFLISIYVLSLTYRNFLSEYLISRNRKVSWLYFWWNVPVINIFAWLTSLLTLKQAIPLNDRLSKFYASQKDTNAGIKTLIITLTSILLLYQLNRVGFRIDAANSTAVLFFLIGTVISFGMLLWYLNAPSGLWVMLGLVAFSMVNLMFNPPSVNSRYHSGPTNYLALANAIILFTLFHLKSVQNVAPISVKPIEDVEMEEE